MYYNLISRLCLPTIKPLKCSLSIPEVKETSYMHIQFFVDAYLYNKTSTDGMNYTT